MAYETIDSSLGVYPMVSDRGHDGDGGIRSIGIVHVVDGGVSMSTMDPKDRRGTGIDTTRVLLPVIAIVNYCARDACPGALGFAVFVQWNGPTEMVGQWADRCYCCGDELDRIYSITCANKKGD